MFRLPSPRMAAMELGFGEARAGRERRQPACPGCRGIRLRYSRRHYEGVWARVFSLRPAKCLDCGAYFPVSRSSAILNPQSDPAELHVPFWPLEMQERADRDTAAGADWAPPETRPSRASRRGTCPHCGSREIRPSSAEEPRLNIKTTFRCTSCNASFQKTVPKRLLTMLVLGMVALGALIFVVGLMTGRGSPRPTPTIKKGQVPKPPPPVFR